MEEEKMNLADFTVGGEPVVESKEETKEEQSTVENATEEQSTDEVSVSEESEVSEETSEKNETSEEPSEENTEEKKEEEVKTEPIVYNTWDPFADEVDETKDPVDSKYTDYKDVIDLLEKDDYLNKAVSYYKDNGDLKPFLEAFQYDYDKLDDLQLLRLKFDGENPELSQKAKDRLFNREVLEKYKIGNNEELDKEEIELGEEILKRDASRIRKGFIERQSEFTPKDRPKPPSEAELKDAIREQRRVVRNGIKDNINDNKISINVEGSDPINYELSGTQNTVDYAVDTNKFLQRFSNKDGNIDWGLWTKTVAFLDNPDGFVKELVNYGKSLGRKSIEAEIKNEEPLVSKKDVKVEEGGITPFDDKAAFLKHALENKR